MKKAEIDIPIFLKVAEELNPLHGITGFLSYDENDVFQYIEGPSESIEQLVINIKKDSRQERFKTMIKCPLKFRVCPNGWHMKKTGHSEYMLMIKGIYDTLKQSRSQREMNMEKKEKYDFDE